MLEFWNVHFEDLACILPPSATTDKYGSLVIMNGVLGSAYGGKEWKIESIHDWWRSMLTRIAPDLVLWCKNKPFRFALEDIVDTVAPWPSRLAVRLDTVLSVAKPADLSIERLQTLVHNLMTRLNNNNTRLWLRLDVGLAIATYQASSKDFRLPPWTTTTDRQTMAKQITVVIDWLNDMRLLRTPEWQLVRMLAAWGSHIVLVANTVYANFTYIDFLKGFTFHPVLE